MPRFGFRRSENQEPRISEAAIPVDETAVLGALRHVIDPDLQRDVVSLGMLPLTRQYRSG